MASVTRTTGPLDAEVILPDADLSAMQTLYKEWQDTFVSPNPVQAQVEFFTTLATKIRDGELDLEYYQYWYNKVKISHPEVLENLGTVAEYADVNESVGTLWFAGANPANTANSSLATTMSPYPANIESLLPDGVATVIKTGYSTVNAVYSENVANFVEATPTAAHGVSLVKDTEAIARNNSSKTGIKSELDSKFGIALDLTEIENTISGDISVPSTQVQTDVEGATITVDELGNKVDPSTSTLTIASLEAEE